MTRLQRIFIALGLPFLACALHVSLCDWHYKAALYLQPRVVNAPRYPILCLYDTKPATGGEVVTGLTTGSFVDYGTAVVWGVFAPLAIIAGVVCWILGWPRQLRLAAGRCAACGYDLHGSSAQRCPECGAATGRGK